MKTIHDLTALVVLAVVHTIVSFGAYRYLTERTESTLPPAEVAASAEAVSPKQRARGDDSSRPTVLRKYVTVLTPWPVELYVVFGYTALAVSLILSLAGWLRTASR